MHCTQCNTRTLLSFRVAAAAGIAYLKETPKPDGTGLGEPTSHLKETMVSRKTLPRAGVTGQWNDAVPRSALDAKGESRWAWHGNQPSPKVGGSELHFLEPADLRLLGRSALSLYCRLERIRGWTADTFCVDLGKLADELGLRYRTAQRALARLKACGAVQVHTATRLWHPCETRPEEAPKWTRLNTYRVFGSWDLRNGTLRVALPEPEWLAWKATQKGWGGRREGAGRPPAENQDGALPFRAGFRAREVSHTWGDQDVALYSNTITRLHGLGTCVPKPAASPAAPPGGVFLQPDPQSLDDIDTTASHRPEWEPRVPQLPIPPRAPLPRLHLAESTLEDGYLGYEDGKLVRKGPRTPEWMKAMSLVSGYRAGVKKVYGQAKAFYVPRRQGLEAHLPAITKSKLYPRLLKAVDALIEHHVPPRTWAEWYLALAKEKGWNNGKPPSIGQVFAPATIKKWRGWFEDTHSGQREALVRPEQVHIEQHLRIREIHDLNRGLSPEAALSSMPAWYRKMRRQELQLGYEDPNVFYPQLGRR